MLPFIVPYESNKNDKNALIRCIGERFALQEWDVVGCIGI